MKKGFCFVPDVYDPAAQYSSPTSAHLNWAGTWPFGIPAASASTVHAARVGLGEAVLLFDGLADAL